MDGLILSDLLTERCSEYCYCAANDVNDICLPFLEHSKYSFQTVFTFQAGFHSGATKVVQVVCCSKMQIE